MFSSELLLEGSIYTRKDLSEKFSITDATIHTGVFSINSYHSIWLFITEKKTEDATQYTDLLENDTLLWDGQMEGYKDKSIINHEVNGIEILVFYRKKKNEFERYGFKYEGRFRYVIHTGSRPTHFVLQHIETVAATSLKEANATYKEKPNEFKNVNTSVHTHQQREANAAPKTLKITFCYARANEKPQKRLDIHLSTLKRTYPIESWFDGKIEPGSNWEKEIATHFNDAHIILLLISPDFIASHYCYDIEMERAIERHERGEVCIIPIILCLTHWQDTPLGEIQAIPRNGKPVTDKYWGSAENAFHQIVDEIKEVIKRQLASST